MFYKRLTHTLNDKGIFISTDENPINHVSNANDDWYLSIYDYNDEQYEKFKATGSVAGFQDVSTKRLVWDFDSANNLDEAKKDALELIKRLEQKSINQKDIVVAFSGNKGFHVFVDLTDRVNVDEFKAITQTLAEGLSTFDRKVSDANRVLRLAGTKHYSTPYFKTNFIVPQVRNYSTDKLKEISSDVKGNKGVIVANKPIPVPSIPKKEKLSPVINTVSVDNIDFFKKVKGWSNCKWALYNGFEIRGGDRHDKLACIVATSRALNYPKEVAYYNAKHAYEKGLSKYNEEAKEGWKEELWHMVQSIYHPNWKGGTYTCKDGKTEWLTAICNSLGCNACNVSNLDTVDAEQVFGLFESYAENYENNILTTGIQLLDEKCKFLVGTTVGILAAPGVGKTSMALEMLKHNSEANVQSMFFSYDMFHSMVTLRLIEKEFNLSPKQIFTFFKHDKSQVKKWRDDIKDIYKNVSFCFKSGQTPDDIQQTIIDAKNNGKNIKLVLVDYNELVITNNTDPTQSSAIVAQRLRQIANDTETCVVTLLQPSKVFSNPADEIKTYQGAKGSNAIAQSLSMMLSLSRPGYSPDGKTDHYLTINCLKNRQGPLFSLNFGWDGLTGAITELSAEQEEQLKELKATIAAQKAQSSGGGIGHFATN